MQDQFLAGSDILVKPVTSSGQQSTTVYLPGNEPWYTMDGKQVFSGGQTVTVTTPLDYIPVYQRGGSIVPKKERARRSSDVMRNDPFTLQIALNSKKQAFGQLYLDDESSYDFEKGEYLKIAYHFENNKLTSVVDGKYKSQAGIERVVIYGYPSAPKSVGMDGKALTFEYDAATKILVIRKPDVNVGKSFTMERAKEPSHPRLFWERMQVQTQEA